VVERGNAVPKNVAVRAAHEEGALADAERGRRTDADDAFLIFAERVGVALPQRLQRGPGLAARRHVLPLFLANRALRRRLRTLGKLRAAGGADEKRHWFIPPSTPPARSPDPIWPTRP